MTHDAPASEGGGVFLQPCTVYFDDLDPFGMVHNARYLSLIERGLFAALERMGFPLGHEDVNVVVRQLLLVFDTPIRQVGDVNLAFWLREPAGRASASFSFRLESLDAGVVYAHGHRTMTKVDLATGQSKPWTDEIRRRFEADLQAPTEVQRTPVGQS